MANSYGFFFNSVSGDRVYDADDFSEWLKPFFLTGVFDGDLEVTAAGNMSVSVAEGYCNIDGKVRVFDSATTLTLSSAHSTLDRIDNIVVRRDDTNRNISLVVQEGTQSSSPVAPTPVRENGVYDLVIAQVYIAAATTAIVTANITDTRSNSNLCGIVSNAVERDVTEIEARLTDLESEVSDLSDDMDDKADQSDLTTLSNTVSNKVNNTDYATSSVFGIVKVDGTTITASDGVISAPFTMTKIYGDAASDATFSSGTLVAASTGKNYRAIWVEGWASPTSAAGKLCAGVLIFKGNTSQLNPGGGISGYRSITFASNGAITAAASSTGSTSLCVPYRVWGIR